MSVEIYWGSGSPYAWRVLLAAEAKGVPYVSHLLSFQAKEHKTPEFLKMNPRGAVPVLKDGDTVVTESLAIMHHIDQKAADPSLFGRTPAERTRVLEWSSRVVYDMEDAVWNFARPLLAAKPADDLAQKVAEARPKLEDVLGQLEAALASRPYLAGEALSAADLAAYPFLMFALRAAGKEAAKPLDLGLLPLAARYPRLAAWQGRIEALPGYDRTYPPHWRAM
ncbi:MAG: glutathione S-transferase family protein [Alphaproteobacteria bacterium]|nr:glutathione S-transferase family protein [Alphaproteobacteria bacterium]